MTDERKVLLTDEAIGRATALMTEERSGAYRWGMIEARSIYEADRAKLLAEIDRLMPWAKMGAWALETSRDDLTDLEGGEIQDAAEGFGLLNHVEVSEPCCDECRCAEYDDFPQKCIRLREEFNKPIPLPEKVRECGWMAKRRYVLK